MTTSRPTGPVGVAGRRPFRPKQFPAVATRLDKLAVRYQASACVADSFIWLRASPDRSRSHPSNTPQGLPFPPGAAGPTRLRP